MKRREFLHSSLTLAAAAVAAPATLAHAAEPPPATAERARVQAYRTLGGTGIAMSDISFGAGRLPSASLVLRAIDRGINYFDTAPDYGQSEEFIGQALKKYTQRDKIHIASKFCRPIPYTAGKSHLQPGTSRQEYVEAVEGSLKRMGTDYLDLVFVHAIGETTDEEAERRRLFDPEMLEAFARLKEAGKARFLAVSSHGPHNLETLLLEAVRSGHYDVLMAAFNFLKFPQVPRVLQEARSKGVGVIAMKTLAGAKESNAPVDGGVPFEQAAFKWVLNHPEVAGLVVSMKSAQDLDLYLPASGERFARADQEALDRYAALHGSDYCRTGCGDCSGSCPAGVEIANILRYQMYFADYGEEKRAMQSYAALATGAGVCGACAGAPCDRACPYGLPVRSKLEAAHRALTLQPAALV